MMEEDDGDDDGKGNSFLSSLCGLCLSVSLSLSLFLSFSLSLCVTCLTLGSGEV